MKIDKKVPIPEVFKKKGLSKVIRAMKDGDSVSFKTHREAASFSSNARMIWKDEIKPSKAVMRTIKTYDNGKPWGNKCEMIYRVWKVSEERLQKMQMRMSRSLVHGPEEAGD